ncbi:SFU1 [Candida jiufengensis]|uniref:SFU1 n=1 Tax=Candida jiufengensis TaxID=497108 RepID=UPI0022241034|nr:SFU1 [Candida jiufengensis]KAI5954633.1 SFU1 [Candida jiufengensis]
MNSILNNKSINSEITLKAPTPIESETDTEINNLSTNNSIIAPKIQSLNADDGQQCSNCGTTKTPLWRRAPDGTLICNACGLYLRSNNTHRPVNLKRPPNTITVAKVEEGSCKGDGRCNGTGGSAACKGCPAFNNRIVAKKSLEKSPKTNEDIYSTEITNQTIQQNQQQSEQNLKRGSINQDKNKNENGENSLAIACFNCDTTITPLWRRDDAGNTICNACGLFYRLHGSHRPIKMKRATIKRRKRNTSLNHENKDGLDDSKAITNNRHQQTNQQQPQYSTIQQPFANPASSSISPNFPPLPSNYNRLPPLHYPLPFQRGPTNIDSTTQQQQQQQQQQQSSIPSSLYPRYNGSGRLPNGPGPLPGPPPPLQPGNSFNNQQQQPHRPHQQPTPPPINIPDIKIDPNTLPPIRTDANGNAIGSGCCKNCVSVKKLSTPMAIDFTASYKINSKTNSRSSSVPLPSRAKRREDEEEDDSESALARLRPNLAKEGNAGNGSYDQKKAFTIVGLLNK